MDSRFMMLTRTCRSWSYLYEPLRS